MLMPLCLGHSLGGALASLVGVTFGVPVVAFEAPAERLAAHRLHLPSPVCHAMDIEIASFFLTSSAL